MSIRKDPAFVPFLIAAGLHLLIGIVLIVGASFSLPKEKPKKEIAVINATVISQQQFDDLANRKDVKRAAAQRKKDQLRKKKEKIKRDKDRAKKREIEKKKRKEEAAKKQEIKKAQQKKLKKEQALRKKKEVERVKAEKLVAAKAAMKKKEQAQAKKKADAKRKQKVEQDRLQAKKLAAEKARKDAKRKKDKQIKDRKIKEEKARKAKLEKQRKAKLAQERLHQAELDSLMAAEFDESFSSAQSSETASEIARYKALIQAKISRNWQVEPSMKGKTCTLAIRLASDGLVLSVKRSRGDTKLCNSARRATLKSKILPIPKDPEISSKFRDFDITLEPEL